MSQVKAGDYMGLKMRKRLGIALMIMAVGLLLVSPSIRAAEGENPGLTVDSPEYLDPEVQLYIEQRINEKNLEDYGKIIEIKTKAIEDRFDDYLAFGAIIIALLTGLGFVLLRQMVKERIDKVVGKLKPEEKVNQLIEKAEERILSKVKHVEELGEQAKEAIKKATEIARTTKTEDATPNQKEIVKKGGEGLKKKPEAEYSADDYFARGFEAAIKPNYFEAITFFSNAIQLKPDFQEAWNNKGNALAALGQYKEAIAAYDKAIQLKPDYHEAWDNKGVALADLAQYKEAIAAYDKAIQLKPDYHEAWYNKGVALAALGQYKEAIAAYDEAIKIKPDFSGAYYNLACVYSCKKDKANALNHLNIAIDKGYDELKHIEKDSDIDFIRDTPEYRRIMKKLEAKLNR